MPASEVNAEIRRVGDFVLREIEEHEQRLTQWTAHLPGYRALDDEELRPLRQATSAGTVRRVLIDPRPLDADDVDLMRQIFEVRARQVTEEQFRLGIDISLGELWARVAVVAERLGLSIDAWSELRRRWVAWRKASSELITEVFREAVIESARTDANQRTRFLYDALHGNLYGARLETAAAAYGLAGGNTFHTIRARSGLAEESIELERSLDREARRTAGLVGNISGDVAALLLEPPGIASAHVVAGLGPRVSLADSQVSFRKASHALEVAAAFGLTGMFSLDQLGLLRAVHSGAELGDDLVARYLAPLDAMGDYGKVLQDTLRAYIANGAKIEATAKAIFVHVNTLRRRLAKIEQLSHADLKRTTDLFEAWWALQRRALEVANSG